MRRRDVRTQSRFGATFVALGHTALLAAVVGIGACAPAKVPAAVQADRGPGGRVIRQDYEARVRRTSFGIPHLVAADLCTLGFGVGYAQVTGSPYGRYWTQDFGRRP